MACATIALPARAIADTVTFEAPTIVYARPAPTITTGYFDITIRDTASNNSNLNDGGTQGTTGGSDLITAFQVEVTTTGGITFPSSDDQTQAGSPAGGPVTYLFASNSADDPSFNGSNTTYSFSNQDVFLPDAATNAGTTLTAGTPLGLLRVEYSIPANFIGTVPIDIAISPDSTVPAVWADSAFNTNTPLVVNGSITVSYPPEPSSLVLLVLGALGLAFHRLVNRRRQSAACRG